MSIFTSENKSSASFIGVNKSSDSFYSESKSTYVSGGSTTIGSPIGLLLSLTYATVISGSTGGWQSTNKS
jgi:hypothetical protein